MGFRVICLFCLNWSLATLALGVDVVLLEDKQSARVLIPSVGNGGNSLGVSWVDPGFDDANWLAGNTGVGFDDSPSSGGDYSGLARLDVSTMRNNATSVFIRVPFLVSEAVKTSLQRLTLEMWYDDGFVAWLNGVEVASALRPLTLSWNSATLNGQTHDANPTAAAEFFDLTPHVDLLRTDAPNVLAIQGLNANATSSDLLIAPRVTGGDTPPVVLPEVRLVPLPGTEDLELPVGVRGSGDGSGRLFIIERRGRIKVWNKGVLTPFLDISDRVLSSTSSGDEQGLLGLAFPPGFPAQRPYLYVYYTTRVAPDSGDQVIARYFLNQAESPGGGLIQTADASSEVIVTRLDDPYGNHNGGDMHFGRDGYLYVGLGDGGAGDDPRNYGQDTNSLWGKMIRIDVESGSPRESGYRVPEGNPFTGQAGVRGEIWHLGVRNPWRWSFDRETGDMWIGDVGQSAYEEISFAGQGVSGLNFGWRRYEGFHLRPGEPATGGTAMTLGTLAGPITETTHASGDYSITGGYVYRGARFPSLKGMYFFADYGSRRFYGLRREGEAWARHTLIANTGLRLSSFGEGDDGELYATHLQGVGSRNTAVFQIGSTMAADTLSVSDVSHDPATGRFRFVFSAKIGSSYQVQSSDNLVNWSDVGASFTATHWDAVFVESFDPPAGTERRFFRAVELGSN